MMETQRWIARYMLIAPCVGFIIVCIVGFAQTQKRTPVTVVRKVDFNSEAAMLTQEIKQLCVEVRKIKPILKKQAKPMEELDAR